MKEKNVLKNIVMLYGFSIAKIVFPLLTLPYLTRVLSVDAYGTVGYVKSIMTYMQLVIDFGFMLSGTKEIVLKKDNKCELSRAVGDILFARIILSAIAFVSLVVLCSLLPILKNNVVYTILSFVPVLMTIFLFDYVFRGFEHMQVITSRFVLMKSFSTLFTFILVKSDSQLMLIPILDIIGSICAIILVLKELKKLNIKIAFSGLEMAILKLKESAIYFASNIATTVGGALSTILIGAFLNASDIAYWTAALQIVNAVLALYNPVVDGVYPSVVKSHDYKIIKKLFLLFMPLIVCGCVFVMFFSNYIVTIAFGYKYLPASKILQALIPVFLFAFPAQILGWPMLGTIGKTKQVTLSTITYGLFNIVGLFLLIVLNIFTLKYVVILRSAAEFVLFIVRFGFCISYRKQFKEYVNFC